MSNILKYFYLDFCGQSGPIECQTRWPRGQIKRPRATRPVLTACLNFQGCVGEKKIPHPTKMCQSFNKSYWDIFKILCKAMYFWKKFWLPKRGVLFLKNGECKWHEEDVSVTSEGVEDRWSPKTMAANERFYYKRWILIIFMPQAEYFPKPQTKFNQNTFAISRD